MNWWALKRKLHISWLITIGCFGIFIGIFAAQYINWHNISATVFLIVSILLITIALWRRYIYLIPFLIFGSVMFGLWRGSIPQSELAAIKPLIGQNITVFGTVKDDIDIGTSDQIVIRLNELIINNKPLSGTFWITSSNSDIKRGDKLLLNGVLSKGFGNFAGTIHRADISKITHPQPGDVARIARDWFADAVRKVIPEPESSLGIGYLVGQRRSLPADLVLALQMVGLTHIVVASGYNLTILVRLARRLFVKVSKYLSTLSAVLMIVSFIAITGASPSMARAGIVSLLSLLAWYYGRKFHPITLLSIAIAATVVINPSYAWGDLGWQLSFAAFAGVMIVAPLLQRYLFGDKKPGFVGQILGETISAQLVTAPIIISAFGQLSNVAILANFLILPLVPLAMLLTFIAGLGSLILPNVAAFISLPATWLLDYMISVIQYLANLPWSVTVMQFPWWAVLICYVMIISGCLYMWRVTKFNLREVNIVE